MSVVLWLQLILFLPGSIPQLLPRPTWPNDKPLRSIDDYNTIPFGPGATNFAWYMHGGVFNSTGRKFTAFVGIITNPAYFSIEIPLAGCSKVENTSDTARLRNCQYATNGGYFGLKDDKCIGNLMTNSKWIQVTGLQRANFAITSNSYVLGYLSNETIKSGKFDFVQVIQGAGWLVRNGVSFVNESKKIESLNDYFVGFEAPRTSLGIFKNGTIILAEVDGVEVFKEGASLYELAEWLVELGVYHSINLDGGGSSVSVVNGTVVSFPTCHDIPLRCERPVTSITCIHQLH